MNFETVDGLVGASFPPTVCAGSNETIYIQKDYGPLVFADVRITAVAETCEWVVERQRIDTQEWVEVARFPGQMPEEFP